MASGRKKTSSDSVDGVIPKKLSKAAASMNYHDDDGFCDGSIVQIKLKNFLTYDDCCIRPGPNLNVIVGPNGTGKSSIVCAICLGLGESPTVLGRAKQLGDFVKHTKNQAMVEIELKNCNGQNHVIRRDIFKEGNRSQWHFNGKPIIKRDIEEKIKSLNIQMSNLCQFLPQDRVAEFAKMTQQELLQATEKAIGPPQMYENHMELIKFRDEEKTVEASLNEKVQHKEKLEQINNLLEREVQRFNERQKHVERIEMLEKKKPWAQYEEGRLKFVELKNKRDQLEKGVRDARRVNEPNEKKLNHIDERIDEISNANKQLTDQGKQFAKKVKTKSDALEKQADQIEEIQSEMKAMRDQEKHRRKRINEMEMQIKSLEKDIEDAPDPAELQPRNKDIIDEAKSIQKQISKVELESSQIKEESGQMKGSINGLNRQLKELNDLGKRRLEELRRSDKDAYNAVNWLHGNNDKFQGTIYEPIMMQINMKDINDSKYLEFLITNEDLRAFVCENKKDQGHFLNETRERQDLRINVVAPSDNTIPLSSYKPSIPIDQLRQYGFKCFVMDLFDAPDTVMRYLCESYCVHEIPVGTEKTNQMAGTVIEKCGIPFFFTSTSRYNIKKSLYSGEKSTRVDFLRDGRILNVSVDVEKKKELEANINETQRQYKEKDVKYREFQEEHKGLNGRLEKLRQEKKELMRQMNRRKTIQGQIDTKKKNLDNLQREALDIDNEEKKVQKKVTVINKKRVNLAKEFMGGTEECLALYKEKIMLAWRQVQVTAEKSKVLEIIRESASQLRALEDEFKQAVQEFQRLRENAKRLLEKARQKTNTAKNCELSEQFKQAFSQLPNSVEDIDELIHEERAKAECNYQTDPQVVRNYEKNKKEIQRLHDQVNEQQEVLNGQQKRISEIKEKWLGPIEKLVKCINNQYSDFFRRMGCAGEVNLHKDPDNNYDKFGIEIKVKYRATEKLKVLTSYHQSGGERSVATMLFLISLQELTKCPFRVVDEINQGMDPNNERRVFELVVETVCRPDTSQYFLITPKLLPDLVYTDRMTILFVLNGHWLPDHKRFSVKDFIKKKRADAIH